MKFYTPTKILIILSFISLNTFSLSYERDIFTVFPTLNTQISENLESITDREEIIRKLKSYINVTHPEMVKGLKMLLVEDIYKQYSQINSRQFILDGNSQDWRNVPEVIYDRQEDAAAANADLIEFRCYLDSEYNLHTMYKTKTIPKRIRGQESFGLTIFNAKNPDVEIELRFAEIGTKDHSFIFHKGNKRYYRLDIPYSSNSVFEAKIPLARIFDIARIEKTNIIYVKGFTRHSNIRQNRDAAAFMQVMQKQRNYALTIFLNLLRNNLVIDGDTITLALALANNWLYSMGDDNVKKEIISDCVKHLEFYKKILKWQKQQLLKYPLSDVPVIIKAYWANRITTLDAFNSSMDIKRYKEFVDRIETLEQFHEIALSNNILEDFTFPSKLKSIIQKIDRFIWNNMDYRLNYYTFRDEYYLTGKYKNFAWGPESAELLRNNQYWVDFFGKNRDLHGFMWANYQLRRYKEKGKFIGDCGTHSITTMMMQKSLGIPSNDCGWRGHSFSMYYNPYLNKWESVTIYSGQNDNQLEITKIKWHHKVFKPNTIFLSEANQYPFYFYEKATARLLKNLTKLGLDYTVFEKIFLSGLEEARGMLFTGQTAPDTLPDTDNDGIPDYIEKRLGLNPNNADTDNDGYPDLWEMERGYNPRSNASPANNELFHIIINHPVSFIAKISGYAIDCAHLANNSPIGLYRFHGKEYQLFKTKISNEPDYYYLISLKSGHAISISENGILVNKTPGNLDSQKWKFSYSGNGSFILISKSNGKAISVSPRRTLELTENIQSEGCKWLIR